MDQRLADLRDATQRLATAQHEMVELARLRRRLVQELHAEGMSYARIAEAAGLGRTRIHQIRHSGPGPEGAFFGGASVTIATPLKKEAENARPVVAAEDFAAAQRLADQARTLGLSVEFEHVPLGGRIDLNREALVVICGPRLSKLVGRVLAKDPVITFERADDGAWTLRDRRTGQSYRSGPDCSPPANRDVAYLGRLPRPDGDGSLIVFTGIHPQGSLGVVHYLATELPELHRDVDDRLFSTLLGVDYDPVTNEPVEVRRLSPIYEHEER